MKKTISLLILCLFQANLICAQLQELKIYEKTDIENCKYAYENSKNTTCSSYNSKALLKYENINNVDFIIDFMGGIRDIEVQFTTTNINKDRLEFNGRSLSTENFQCTFIIEKGLIVEGVIHSGEQSYSIDIGLDKKTQDVKMWYYPFTPKSSNKGFMFSDYNDLVAFTGLNDIDTILSIWGKEAHDDTLNTTTGIDLSAPIFHGSYDWHSAVHGHLAANYAGYYLNDYPTYVNTINNQFTAANVQGEVNYYYTSQNSWVEVQYGLPWLLNYSAYLDNSIYENVANPLNSLTQNSYNLNYNHVVNNLNNYNDYVTSLDTGYFNFNWQLLNLYIYAEQNNLPATMNYVTNQLNSYAQYINWNNVAQGDFFDPKSLAIMLYTKVGLTSGTAWNNLMAAYASSSKAVPFADLSQEPAHNSGLVLSKSWGYWLMYYYTGDTTYKDAFIEHIDVVYQYLKSQQNSDPVQYFTYLSHWVPNFGVFGLKLVEDYPVSTLSTDGFEQNINSEFVVYPTAVNDILNINLNFETANTKLTIVDMKGSIVYNQTHTNKTNQIDVSRFQSGVYVIIAKNENKELSSKFIKL